MLHFADKLESLAIMIDDANLKIDEVFAKAINLKELQLTCPNFENFKIPPSVEFLTLHLKNRDYIDLFSMLDSTNILKKLVMHDFNSYSIQSNL